MDDQYTHTHKLSFLGEWFQQESSIARIFYIYFYPDDNAIEIFDQRTKKLFLKRTKIDSITESDFYTGAKLNILGRQISILDFYDLPTRNKLANLRKRTFLAIRQEAIDSLGEILNVLIKNSYKINQGRMVKLNSHNLAQLFGDSKKSEWNATEIVIGFEVIADQAVEKLRVLIANDADTAEEKNPLCFHTLCYCSQTEDDATKELKYFFNSNSNLETTAILDSTTLCIIKPHVIREGKFGDVITDIIRNGFNVTGLKMVLLEKPNAEEFYEVYRGVLPEYIQMVAQLTSGICIAIELTSKDKRVDPQSEFRKLCGPIDPAIARQLRPQTLRSKYGQNKILNAVHCTDLPDDTLLEIVHVFFLKMRFF